MNNMEKFLECLKKHDSLTLPANIEDAIYKMFYRIMNDDLQGLYDSITPAGKELLKEFQQSSFSIDLHKNAGTDDVYIKGFMEGMRASWIFLEMAHLSEQAKRKEKVK